MLARDHYATLGLGPHATAEEIEQAYRHLSRRYHPDVNLGDPRAGAVYERIQAAYEVLSDPEQRALYDRGTSADPAMSERVDLDVQVRTEPSDTTSWPRLLARLSEHARALRPRRGADLEVTVDLPLAFSETGRRVPLRLRRRVPCDACRGSGRVRRQRAVACERCGGDGREAFSKGALTISAPCRECRGEGVVSGSPCEDCGASGLVAREERSVLRIPAGVGDGHELRVLGAGHFGPRGGAAGDLVARVKIVDRDGYERAGPHLRASVDIPYTLAILGGRVPVETLAGETVSLRVPPVTQSGDEFRLRGRGLEMSDGRRGDMLVRVRVRLPEVLDEDDKSLVRQLAERSRVQRVAHPARAAEGDR